jgi:YVTN family beta-propeller protein
MKPKRKVAPMERNKVGAEQHTNSQIPKEGSAMTSHKFSRKRIGQALGLLALGLVLLVGGVGLGQPTDSGAGFSFSLIWKFRFPPPAEGGSHGPKGIAAAPATLRLTGPFLAIANSDSNTLAYHSGVLEHDIYVSVLVGSQPLSVDVAAISAAASVANSGSKEGTPPQIRASQAQQQVLRAFTANFGSDNVSVVDIQIKAADQPPELRVVETIKVGRQPTSLDFDPNSNRLYVNNFGDNSVSVIEVKATGSRVIATIGGFREPIFVRISPDGKRGYVSSQRRGQGVAVFDTAKNAIIGRIDLPNVELRRLALSPDGKRLYVAVRTDFFGTGEIAVIDTESLQVIQRYRTEPFPLEIAVTPNGRCLVITHSVPNRVSLMDATDGEFISAQDPTANEPQSVAIIENRAYVTNYRSDTISVFEFGEQCAEKKS